MRYHFILTMIILVIFSLSASAITFDTQVLQDKSDTNYIEFNDTLNSLSNSFEKIVADFNGDGFDDILSLGGDLRLIEDLITVGGAIIPSAPLSLMLNQDGLYVQHNTGINNYSSIVDIVDIDKDGDLDIVMMYRTIAINDGQANFTEIAYSTNHFIEEIFYTADFDGDNDLDIISKNYIFKNNGNLEFIEEVNDLAIQSDLFSIADINNDGVVDMLVLNNNELQSWLNNGAGSFELLSSIQVPEDAFLIHALSLDTNNNQNFIVSFHGETQDYLQLLQNDGQGNLSNSAFPLETPQGQAFETLKIGKLYNRDANNDGIEELWVASIFRHNASCENSQNLMLLYGKTIQGTWQHELSLHSEGLVKDSLFLGFRITVDSFPTLVDLNNDNLPDVVFTGEKPQTWVSQEAIFDPFGVSFHLSNTSMFQYNMSIDTADYDNDGDQDVFSATQFIGSCQTMEFQGGFYTAKHYVRSTLWLNELDGKFKPFFSGLGGGNDFLRPYEYMIFADLEADGVQNIIATIPDFNDQARASFYVYPRLADPGLAFKLPEVTLNAKVINIDPTGIKKEIIMLADTQEAPILVLTQNSGRFLELARLEFGARNGDFKLADMDGDGNIDIVANSKANSNSVTIWYNDGQRQFTASDSFANNVESHALLDINNDGKLDILTFNPTHDIWINQGQRLFSKIEHDDSYWHIPTGATENFINIIPSKVEVADFNSDGKHDLIIFDRGGFAVYINESNANRIWFYKVQSSSASGEFNNLNYTLSDMNNDGLLDYVGGNQGAIKINTQTQEKLATGLYYDPEFNGHGFSIDEIGRDNLFYSVFYSYDDFGKPEWYAMLNRYVKSEFWINLAKVDDNQLIRFKYDFTTGAI